MQKKNSNVLHLDKRVYACWFVFLFKTLGGIRKVNKEEQLKAKILNNLVNGNKFENEDIDNYIYASLSQPPIKIIDKNGSDNAFDYTVECSNCGSRVNYGQQTYMLSGHIYCDNKGCRDKLVHILGGKYE